MVWKSTVDNWAEWEWKNKYEYEDIKMYKNAFVYTRVKPKIRCLLPKLS